ncbi:MAG: ABC transporter substrate-binding protein [Rhodocyclaceae bacterium]|jgi:NitT/TauT family transport system substrate-binding protein|nr:ABC transporter substrate-binding protein [Rhodocyclaceae bacterium]
MRRLIALLGLAFLLAACAPEPTPPLRLAVNPWIGYDPFVLARDRGPLDARLRIVEVASNSDSQRALANGMIEAAALTLDEALRLADAGVPLEIVAVLDVSAGADAVLARPEIDRLDKLRGRRIGVEAGAVGALMLARLLAAAGIDDSEVTILSVEAGQHVAVLTSGRVDAVVTFEPMKSQLARRGYRVLFDSRVLPGEIIDVLVVRPGVDARPLLAAWQTGLAALEQDRLAAAQTLARGVELSAEEYLDALSSLRLFRVEESAEWFDGGAAAPLARRAQPVVAELMRRGEIKQPPDWAALLGKGRR